MNPKSLPAVAVALIVFALPACRSSSPLFQPERSADMEEAGAVHLAVLAVAPWSEYASALQPDFSLTSDDAVDMVARDSRWQGQQTFSGAQAGAQSTLLVQPSDPTDLRTAQPGGNSTTSPDGTLQLFSPPDRPYQDSRGRGEQGPSIGPDAMLKYTAATALYQEVQLLNRHVRDAAIPAGFRPYMVRLQLSLMPSRRHAPYDAYTTLSFFIPGERAPLAVAGAAPVRSTSDAIFESPFGNGPKVLPLVVTDNLEASVQSRSIDRIRGLTASLLDFEKYSLANAGTTFLGDVVRPMYSAMLAKAMRDEVFGRDLNSLLTVARLSENTLRIRLGAMQEATANYAMVPRNHNITLLLMVPEGAPPLIEVVAKTTLVDTEDGLPLATPDERDEARRLERFRRAWGLEALDPGVLRTLHTLAQQNDQESFAALLRASLPSDDPALLLERSIWIELVGMRLGEEFTSNLFELPGQGQDLEQSSSIFEAQTVVVEDDETFAYVTLREARFPESERVLAVLRPAAEPVESAEDDAQYADAAPGLVLPAESVKADISRREIRMRFPSLVKWDLAQEGEALDLALTWGGQERHFTARLKVVTGPTQRKALEPAYDFERPPSSGN